MKRPVYDLIIGNVPGVRGPENPDPDWSVKEVPSEQCEPHNVEETASVEIGTSVESRDEPEVAADQMIPSDDVGDDSDIGGAVETRAQKQKRNENLKPLKTANVPMDDVTPEQLRQAQKEDSTLKNCFKHVGNPRPLKGFPEAVPLRNIDTERVAEALVDIFSRVGVPSEILTDRGSQFTSDVMKEVSRLLSLRQLTTTPYHPICNGLVEKFNGTLKRMLKRMCEERPSDWDRYIGPLLFAYREAPQASTGFAPFELLYGRTVRGPMAILKEMWTSEVDNPETRSTYQYVLDLRERLEETCALARSELQESSRGTRSTITGRLKVASSNQVIWC
ncbi:hypothetical protein BSL78_06013 [Apostichopus japonicus]|uniref:Integrase catalytic domain-containing protein n=1 Tax=Stichopus japonicus TaxID=307972 RepID=A0A2G8L9Y6_STIJA|nr:hypothetical protein BSL78_06013 [Apostichopus japonicus]